MSKSFSRSIRSNEQTNIGSCCLLEHEFKGASHDVHKNGNLNLPSVHIFHCARCSARGSFRIDLRRFENKQKPYQCFRNVFEAKVY